MNAENENPLSDEDDYTDMPGMVPHPRAPLEEQVQLVTPTPAEPSESPRARFNKRTYDSTTAADDGPRAEERALVCE